MKIISLKELLRMEGPVLVSWANMDEESVGELMLCYIDRSKNRQGEIKATHFGVSAPKEPGDWLDTLYGMIEKHNYGRVIGGEWQQNIEHVPWEEPLSGALPNTLIFTGDEEDVKFILYTKEDIKRMAAMFASLVEKLS